MDELYQKMVLFWPFAVKFWLNWLDFEQVDWNGIGSNQFGHDNMDPEEKFRLKM